MVITAKKTVLFSILALAFSVAADRTADAGNAEKPTAAAADTGAAVVSAAPLEEAGDKKVEVTDASFRCLHEMKKVRSMYVDNLLGDVEGTLAVANAADGGSYPPGSVLQLFPGEVMVKREKGANSASNDWEFFTLDVTAAGAKITQRGFDPMKPVKNMFGTCVSCHSQAAPKWDMVCEKGHGCPPINFPGGINTAVLTTALQKTDKRCPSPEPLTGEEIAELGKLKKLLEAQAAAHAGAAAPTGGQQ